MAGFFLGMPLIEAKNWPCHEQLNVGKLHTLRGMIIVVEYLAAIQRKLTAEITHIGEKARTTAGG